MNVAVTGGAGYIGSHAVQHLANAGHRVVAIDNLCTGHRQAIDPRATLVELDLRNTQAVRDVLERYQIEAVLHFAAISVVGDSVHQPLAYWDNNVGGAMSLLTAMASAKVHKLVFSSTCSTYGEPKQMPISESAPQEPQNPYGHTKLAIERLIRDYARAEPQFGYTILRYFNVAGCDMSGRLGEDHRPETHLIPLLLQAAAGVRDSISIYGTDYDTPDGTCIRDYLHVDDLISAHELALNQLRHGAGDAMNLGLGKGFSVRELVDVARSVTGVDFTVHETARRAGDVPVLY
ncbi:MAG: UDP-glucose 4-epimerase GalE, partial [Myxococcales bacterium]|nr:UDP-glucose 4-epimerase GalE [Myxococcales bacterium]